MSEPRPRLFESPTLRASGEFILPTEKEAEERILAVFERLQDWEVQQGFEWYFRAHDKCAELVEEFSQFGLDTNSMAGLVAALSPQASWSQNLVYARLLLTTDHAPTLGHSITSARQIRDGEDPVAVLHHKDKNNLKVRSFHHNIANPDTSTEVTIDRHAWNLLFDDPKATRKGRLYIKPDEYRWAAERYRQIAHGLGCMPHQIQAATWLGWKPPAIGDRQIYGETVQGELDWPK
ncbi:hypothetical protein H6800_03070 [Candidatus Nomurabacteria bacterium]|nr:hypothetical protein [Candidatus Nomurabacteria bacterium]